MSTRAALAFVLLELARGAFTSIAEDESSPGPMGRARLTCARDAGLDPAIAARVEEAVALTRPGE